MLQIERISHGVSSQIDQKVVEVFLREVPQGDGVEAVNIDLLQAMRTASDDLTQRVARKGLIEMLSSILESLLLWTPYSWCIHYHWGLLLSSLLATQHCDRVSRRSRVGLKRAAFTSPAAGVSARLG